MMVSEEGGTITLDKDKRFLGMKSHRKFLYFIIFEILFWFLSTIIFNSMQYQGSKWISIAFVIWFFFEKDIEWRFSILLSGLPFQAITKITATTPSVSVLLYIVFILNCFILRGHKIRKRTITGFLILALLQVVCMVRFNAAIVEVLSTLMAILFAVMAHLLFREKDIDSSEDCFVRYAWVYSVSVLVEILAVYLFPRLPYYISRSTQRALDLIGRYAALNGDPNYYGQVVLIAVGFMLFLLLFYIRERKTKPAIVSIVFIILLIINGLKSLSKGFVISLAAVVVLFVWFLIMEGKKPKNQIFYFVLFIIGGVLIGVLMYQYIIMPVFSQRTEADLFTGRTGIWNAYLEMLGDDLSILLFGTGISNSSVVVSRYLGMAEAAHNLYLESLCDIGIIGFGALVVLWGDVKYEIKALFSSPSSLFAWGFIVSSASISAGRYDSLFFVAPMLTLCCKITKKRER